jgi:hypothetical protein
MAVTAVSLTACVLLVALWVRSHRYRDSLDVYGGGSRMLRVISWEGVILFAPWVFGSGSKPEAGFSHTALSNAQLEALHAQVGRPPKKNGTRGNTPNTTMQAVRLNAICFYHIGS